MVEYINHFTLNTEHCRKSYRNEIADDFLVELSKIFAESLNGFSDLEMDGKKFKINTTLVNGTGLTTLYYMVNGEQVPLLTTAYSKDSYEGFEILKGQQKMFYPENKKMKAPKIPYVADLLYPSVALVPDCSTWTGDFTRCMAWMGLYGKELLKK